MMYKEKIEHLILPLIEADNMELVEVECLKMKSRWLVRVYVDKAGGITIDDCSNLSRQIGDVLDVHDTPPGSYTLEVSSPGLDRPLVKEDDFLKVLGRMVRIRLREKVEGSKNIKGRLAAFTEEGGTKILTLEVEGKTFRVPKEMVLKANLVYEQ